MEDTVPTENVPNKRNKIRLFVYLGIFICAIIIVYFTIISGPKLEKPVIIHISQGDRMPVIAQILEEKNLIKSPLFFQSFVAFLGGDQKINPGDYYFEGSTWLPGVAYRMARGIHKIQPIKITIPEGSTNVDIVKIIKSKLPNIDASELESAIEGKQGYLFPDTYFFYPLSTVSEIVEKLSTTFEAKIKMVFDIKAGYESHSKNEVVIMASLVEEESKNERDARIISGILWQRLKIGMPLQVDVAPWTYKNKGLPEFPIVNAGMRALTATVSPDETDYLYYLHDKNGMIHLAKTYTEHKNNIRKYLK